MNDQYQQQTYRNLRNFHRNAAPKSTTSPPWARLHPPGFRRSATQRNYPGAPSIWKYFQCAPCSSWSCSWGCWPRLRPSEARKRSLWRLLVLECVSPRVTSWRSRSRWCWRDPSAGGWRFDSSRPRRYCSRGVGVVFEYSGLKIGYVGGIDIT